MATPIRPTINDTFQKMLSDLESVGLSEGDYLSMSNSLKKAFDTVERKEELKEIKHTYPIDLEIVLHSGIGMNFKIIVSSVEITYINRAPNKHIAKVVIKNFDTNEIVVEEKLYTIFWAEHSSGDTPFETNLARLCRLSDPSAVRIITRERMIINYDMPKVMLNHKKRDANMREIMGMEEDDDDDNDYMYTNEMFHRIMICKINQLVKAETTYLESYIPHEMRRV